MLVESGFRWYCDLKVVLSWVDVCKVVSVYCCVFRRMLRSI